MKRLLLTAALLPGLAVAGPIDSVKTILYGDPRTGNPSGIELGVSGVQDGANESVFDFTVDFTGTNYHTDAKLLEFYFNVDPNDAALWSVYDVTAGYNVVTPATVQGGGNNAGFLFELDQQPPSGSGVPLTFTLEYLSGDITSENFENALDWVSNDASLTEGQLGAHVGNLFVDTNTCPQGGCSDSGFAVGDWGSGSVNPQSVDAPAHLALLGLGLVGLGLSRRRQK